jgi:hypothetical protein
MNQAAPIENYLDMKPEGTCVSGRNILSGTLQDDNGTGQFVLVRREQACFSGGVEFFAGDGGIAAVNTIKRKPKTVLGDDEIPVSKASLDYQFSVNPTLGSAVKCCHVSLLNGGDSGSDVTLSLTWRGGAQAILQDPQGELLDYQDGCIIRQGERVKLPATGKSDCKWKIVVPSNSVSVSVGIDNDHQDDAKIILMVDAVFVSSHGASKMAPRIDQESRPGKLPPKEILDIINLTETAGNHLPDGHLPNKGLTVKVVDDTSMELSVTADGSSDVEPLSIYDELPEGVANIGCQKIDLFSGEDIVLGTSGLFENYVEGRISFVSMHLPDWLFLDQASGDIMGVVPLDSADTEPYEFTVYAMDEHGHSAKTTIEIECHEISSTTGSKLHDHEVEEGQFIRIETSGLFADFGLDMNGLEYSADGLPAGLSIDSESGIVSGKAEPGSAADTPFEIIVTAADGLVENNGVGMRFLLQVTGAETDVPSTETPAIFAAIEKLYRLNRECETILAQHDVGQFPGFAISKASIFDSEHDFDASDDGDDTLLVEVISPERKIYLRISDKSEGAGAAMKNLYRVQVPGEASLPDWIEATTEGFVQICCSPARQFVDLEINVSTADGPEKNRNIRIDTFAGEVLPNWVSPLDKQLREAVAV